MARAGYGRAAKLLTLTEISVASGLSYARVRELESTFSWRTVTLRDAEAFCRGCQFDPSSSHDRRHKSSLYLSSCDRHARLPFGWLRQNQQWPRYQKIIQQWRESQNPSVA